MKVLLVMGLLFSQVAWGVPCDCEVRVSPPITGPISNKPIDLKTYTLEEFNSYAPGNQKVCRELCFEKFQEDMPTERLSALLLLHSQNLIQEGEVGYNCTGLTTYKFPVRVKARLGRKGLGNVADFIQVVTHEEPCF